MRHHAFRRREIVASDPILPLQFFARFGEPLDHQPERRLVTAILEDAIQVYLAEPPGWRGATKAVAAAESWFASDETASPFAFRNVCDVLGLDPSAVRSALVRGRARVPVFADRGRPRHREAIRAPP